KGRVGVFEFMEMSDHIRELIMQGASTDQLREAASERGMVTLRDSGLELMYEGTTTLEEVVRETVVD
ncbi:MAG: pilus assembly protein PilB, partial [bacterium]|nr:pilus assembly protein PilB [bacterium]